MDLQLKSGGLGAGNQASVLVNGLERAPNRRGYNVVAIHPASGDVLWADVFDTHGSLQESRRLADAIGRVPAGAIVAAVVREEATQKLTDEAVAALRSVGGSQDIRGHDRLSHLLVGVKGAPAGTALEQSGYTPLEVTMGTPPEQIGMEVRNFALR